MLSIKEGNVDKHLGLYELLLSKDFDTLGISAFQYHVADMLTRNPSHLALNCAKVRYLNATALGSILRAHRELRERGCHLYLVAPSPFVKDMISYLGVDQVLPLKENLATLVEELAHAHHETRDS